MWIMLAFIGLIFLFGVALMFGKCGFIIDAINHSTGAWDGNITEKGHFRLKGLQAMGIAVAMALFIASSRLIGYEWLRYVAIGIIMVVALGVYYLEVKLYVNSPSSKSNETPNE